MILVEGEFDAIYLQQFGLNAVSTMGTSGLTDFQLSLLLKYAANVIISYDGDSAGRKATYGKKLKSGKIKIGSYDKLKDLMPVEIVTLPEERDPNSLNGQSVLLIYEEYIIK